MTPPLGTFTKKHPYFGLGTSLIRMILVMKEKTIMRTTLPRWATWRTGSVSCSTTCPTPAAPFARWLTLTSSSLSSSSSSCDNFDVDTDGNDNNEDEGKVLHRQQTCWKRQELRGWLVRAFSQWIDILLNRDGMTFIYLKIFQRHRHTRSPFWLSSPGKCSDIEPPQRQ